MHCHDLRIGGAADVADLKDDVKRSSFIVADLCAHRRRIRGVGVGASSHAGENGFPLVVSGFALLLSIPLWTWFKTGTPEMQFRGALALDFDDSFGVLHRR